VWCCGRSNSSRCTSWLSAEAPAGRTSKVLALTTSSSAVNKAAPAVPAGWGLLFFCGWYMVGVHSVCRLHLLGSNKTG
jgi:hypothetical protein